MKLSTFLATLPLAAAHSQSRRRCSKHHPDPEKCIFQPVCTVTTEEMFHIKQYYNRKPGMTPEEFNRYWAYEHAARSRPMHLRLGVFRYSQYHSTPEYRDLLRVDGVPPILEFDGAAEYWVPDLETFAAMGSDPEYLNNIQPDEANFIDLDSLRIIIGVDYILVENQNAVEEHGRTF
ncbi:uncharacterized protein DNG_06800 [Cephalotrichum gorgonifer]|uniref:EthD domain-containing protein n=1 Tax=Cephalotrichum gorgonifer TaxID=2041049 RepID=A0AAE8N158_9PEZI|nr:uncharacterized protein DNG_06800 [Cephalotrichum gorgonifer]